MQPLHHGAEQRRLGVPQSMSRLDVVASMRRTCQLVEAQRLNFKRQPYELRAGDFSRAGKLQVRAIPLKHFKLGKDAPIFQVTYAARSSLRHPQQLQCWANNRFNVKPTASNQYPKLNLSPNFHQLNLYRLHHIAPSRLPDTDGASNLAWLTHRQHFTVHLLPPAIYVNQFSALRQLRGNANSN